MRCALAAVGFIDAAVEYNKNVIISTMIKYAERADVVIFGEAFLQGFYGVNFIPGHDSEVAVEKDSAIISAICQSAEDNAIAVSFGFLEKENAVFFSSQMTIDKKGQVIDVYRRVSPGWKEKHADESYREGKRLQAFNFLDKRIVVGLCGDLWFDENINGIRSLDPDLVWWLAYTDYDSGAWNASIKYEYAKQAAKIGKPVLYVNSICMDKENEHNIAKGGACCFSEGKIVEEVASGTENVLVVTL